jgi:hypothetical protein
MKFNSAFKGLKVNLKKIRIVIFVTSDLEIILCEYVIFIIHLRRKLHTPTLRAFSGYH